MKFEKKVIYNLTLDSDEKTDILKYMTAIKNATNSLFCNRVHCSDMPCTECPFNNLTNIEGQIGDLVEKFLAEYRALQKANPNLPFID